MTAHGTGPFPDRTAIACLCLLLPALGVGQPTDSVIGPSPDAQGPSGGLVIRVTSGRFAAPREPTGAVAVVEPGPDDAGPTRGLGEVLDRAPGVFASSRSNGAQDLRLSIRGFGARGNFGVRGIRVYLDGFPLTAPDGQSSLDEIDPGALERVEIRRGLSASLYGSAAGGVIELGSRDPRTAPAWSGGAGVGSDGAHDLRLGFAGQAGAQGWLLEGSRREADGYREQSAQRHDRLGLRYAGDNGAGTRWFATLSALDSPYADDPGGLTAAERDADPRAAAPLAVRFDTGEAVRQQRLGGRIAHRLGDDLELRVAGYGLARDFSNRLPFVATTLERTTAGLSVEVEGSGAAAMGAWRWVLGADADGQRDTRARYRNLFGERGARTAWQDEDVDALGVFALGLWSPRDDLDLELGVRYDRVDIAFGDRYLADGDDSGGRRFEQVSPSLGLVWRQGDGMAWFARAATAFETPTTTELANPSGAGGFNPALDPQRSLGLELGWRWRRGTTAAEVALFDTRVRDQFVPEPIVGQPGRFYYVNAGESRYSGIELDWRARWSDGWALDLAATLARLRFEAFSAADGTRYDGNRIPGVPERQLSARLRYAPPGSHGASATLDWRWVGSRFADNANAVEDAAYQVLGLSVGRDWRRGGLRLRLGAGIDNLLDTGYTDNLRINAAAGRYFEPAPERSFFLSLAIEPSP